jgi:methylthioribose-1-phosphate isomerase
MGLVALGSVRAIVWDGLTLTLLDQRELPHRETYLQLDSLRASAAAIRDMVVRGAPAIGITAAYGAVLGARARAAAEPEHWRASFAADLDELALARPTAVNLEWAIARIRACVTAHAGDTPAALAALVALAEKIHAHDVRDNLRMGQMGAALITPAPGILTHCNTGSLATGGYGTALGVVRAAWSQRRFNKVYAGETRPWLQGARLTAWELTRDGIPVDLLADGAGAALMRCGQVSWVVVGADRVAANGDVANKIGTYSLAVNARYHGIGFMVVAPTSTVDLQIPNGDAIPIEQRSSAEVLTLQGVAIAPPGAGAWNPVFDVTPGALVDVLVTERGVIHRPDAARIERALGSASL